MRSTRRKTGPPPTPEQAEIDGKGEVSADMTIAGFMPAVRRRGATGVHSTWLDRRLRGRKACRLSGGGAGPTIAIEPVPGWFHSGSLRIPACGSTDCPPRTPRSSSAQHSLTTGEVAVQTEINRVGPRWVWKKHPSTSGLKTVHDVASSDAALSPQPASRPEGVA